MSTYYQYPHFPPQTFNFGPQAFLLDYHGAQRSKTPTESLLNHTGLSPGPLTTPPHSRNPSQPPESIHEQPPEQMLYDNGSVSNSPTSVKTPDGDSFEVEMLDVEMRNFYDQNFHAMSTQAPNHTVPVTDHGMYFSNEGTAFLVHHMSLS